MCAPSRFHDFADDNFHGKLQPDQYTPAQGLINEDLASSVKRSAEVSPGQIFRQAISENRRVGQTQADKGQALAATHWMQS